MAIATNFQVTASRSMPQATVDGYTINARGSRYGDTTVENVWPTSHVQADEGSYFFANNAQTGIVMTTASNAYGATTPFIALINNDVVNNPASKRIFLDYITLVTTATGASGTSVQFSLAIDAAARYTSGGTNMTTAIYKANTAGPASIAGLYVGAITAAAVTSAVRYPIGQRYLKPAIPVIGDTYTISSGSVDQSSFLATATITYSLQGVAPLVINPGEVLFMHLWLPSQAVTPSAYAPELGWSER